MLKSRSRRQINRALLGALLLITLLPPVVLLGVTYVQSLHLAEEMLQQTVARFVKRTNTLLSTADQALHRLKKDLERTPAADVPQRLARLVYDDPRFREAGIVDASGRLIATNFGPLEPPVALPPQERADPANAALQVIGLVRTRVMQDRSVVMALPTGGGGDVNVLIDPRILTGYADEVDLGPTGFLAFTDAGGQLLAALGTPPVSHDRLQTDAAGWLQRTGASNGGEIRIVADVSRDWVLRDWWHNLWLVGALTLGCNVLIAGLLHWISRRASGLDHDLRLGLASNEFAIVYQPIVDLVTGRCVGIEALMRWQHPDHGAVSPDVFITLAEQTGQIGALTKWLLQRLVQELAPVMQRHPQLWVSVNIPQSLLSGGTMTRLLRDALAGSTVPAGRIRLEITERQLQEDGNGAIAETMAELRRLGVCFGLDDFGTGSCGMTHLLNLDLTYLKVDKSFVQSIGSDSRAAVVLAALIDMAQRLRLVVVAEGVEKPAQADYLRAANVRLGQGWLFAMPVSAGKLGAFLAENAAA